MIGFNLTQKAHMVTLHDLSKEEKASYSHAHHKLSKQLHIPPGKAQEDCVVNVQIQQPAVTNINNVITALQDCLITTNQVKEISGYSKQKNLDITGRMISMLRFHLIITTNTGIS